MAEFDFEKDLGEQEDSINIQTVKTVSAITGGYNKNHFLVYQLENSMKNALQIDMIVSFMMESGIRMLLSDFESALDRGAKIRILTGNYLGITQPSALYLIKDKLGDRVDLRFFNERRRSFHPKSYFFHYKDYSEMYIGSSNLSRSALTSGIEWNYRFSSESDPENYRQFFNEFEDLFENHSILVDEEELKRYSKEWHKPAVMKDLERFEKKYREYTKGQRDQEDQETKEEKDENIEYAEKSEGVEFGLFEYKTEQERKKQEQIPQSIVYEPRGAQIEALYALQKSRAEGARRALVQAATGIGKTYLAAFDAQNYKNVLFVAHREEILKQAAESFKNVRKSDDYGFFNAKEKCNDKSMIFASVASLGKEEFLNESVFPRDYFEYIVIDECHHAVNDSYQRIVNYFQPKFLLGLTATPERMDGRSIYEICDYNVPYEISLREAINKGMLVPFHYYGIYDETDYSNIPSKGGVYEKVELNHAYIGNARRYDLIYKYYCKYGSRQALGFCSSKEHAEDMAREFSKRGIPSVAVYSNSNGDFSCDRKEAIQKLKTGEIKVIFSVDMFNEGVDITGVDMVMFLRPTESPIVFFQQLGRGLRLDNGKEYLNVLDFIGNYEKAGRIRFLLNGRNGKECVENTGIGLGGSQESQYPDGCLVDFDMRLIDLFQEMDKKALKGRDLVLKEFWRVQELLQRRPTRMDLFTYMDEDVYNWCTGNSNGNIFKHYLKFLNDYNLLSEEERLIFDGEGGEFLNLIETTNMTKVYKMPVLMSFYDSGRMKMAVTEQEVLQTWKNFFDKGLNWKDLGTDIDYATYKKISDKDHLKNILKNPVHYLLRNEYFVQREGYVIALRDDLEEAIKLPFFLEQMRDIVEYREMDYYQRRYWKKQ